MSVVKGKRTQSPLEACHNFYMLRREATNLALNDFGFNERAYRERLEKWKASNRNAANYEQVCEVWEAKNNSFTKWFIDEEARAVLEIMRNIEKEFTIGNSIYPSDTPAKLMEFLVRRYHINHAIGYCYQLKQELQYVIRTLPVDLNKYIRFAEMIDKQIALYKGVRQADNRLIKPRKVGEKTGETLEENISSIFDGIARVIRRIAHIEKRA